MLIVGAASRDLDASDARGWRLGGGVTYGSLALARLGARTLALVGADEQAESAVELEQLRRAGVELRLLNLAGGPVFDNQRLPGGGRVQYAHGISSAMPVSGLPPEWAAPDAVVLSPVADEIGGEWAAAFADEVIVALGWQGLLRRLAPGQRVEPLAMRPLPLIARADLNVVSVEDAVAGGAALAELLPRTGQQLVISNGPRPAAHVTRRERGIAVRLLPVRPVRQPRDETGAGDVLLAAWAAGAAAERLGGRRATRAPLAFGLAAASLRVEHGGLAGVPELRAVCDRLLRRPAGPGEPA